ncbi:MAG: preprotein translocase subunit SecY [Alphaproteobacteria bacterium]|nr:preprotein translocase subunit SecY [Rickettsiales bacterium]
MQKNKLSRKILFTLFTVCVYRVGTYIPVPFIDLSKLADFASVAKSGIFGMLNTFSGGSISRAAIFGLGVMPYITSSIVAQLVISSFPSLKKLRSEGGDGSKKIAFWTRALTLFVGFTQGMVFANSFVSAGLYSNVVSLSVFKLSVAFTMVVGTSILIWLGDICSKLGIVNGVSLIIFSGIIAEVPSDIAGVLDLARNGSITIIDLLFLFIIFATAMSFVVFVERSHRLIYVQYPRQEQSFAMSRRSLPKDNFIPLKLNTAGIIPPIFASAILLLPITIVTAFSSSGSSLSRFLATNLVHGKPFFILCDVIAIVFFSFFYNITIFDTDEIAENLRRGNVFIPGCRPGASTAQLLRSIVLRLSLIGSLYLSILCLVPELFSGKYGNTFLLGGTSSLIVVGVIMDAISNVQTSLLPAKYDRSNKRYDKV